MLSGLRGRFLSLLGAAYLATALAALGLFLAALDGLVDKLERRVRKYKEKLVDHHARDKHKTRYA